MNAYDHIYRFSADAWTAENKKRVAASRPAYTVAELHPMHDGRKSFYRKAKVKTFRDGSKVLQSYETDVLRLDADGTPRRLWSGWSATTGRHVAEFMLQETGAPFGKKQWDALEVNA